MLPAGFADAAIWEADEWQRELAVVALVAGLELDLHLIAPITFAEDVVALLVLDRQDPQVSAADEILAFALSSQVSALLAEHELRHRGRDLAKIAQFCTTTMSSMVDEVVGAQLHSDSLDGIRRSFSGESAAWSWLKGET